MEWINCTRQEFFEQTGMSVGEEVWCLDLYHGDPPVLIAHYQFIDYGWTNVEFDALLEL